MGIREKGPTMSFRDNLQHLRATRSMTQEQLAMMLGVSRQSVTKWEAEKAYPEMDKLLKICQIFDCTLDDLVRGDLTTRAPEPSQALPPDSGASDTIGYVERFETHALRTGIGVACIIVGCAVGMLVSVALTTLTDLPSPETAIIVFVLLFVLVGLAILVPECARHNRFMRKHPFVIDFFTSKDREQIDERVTRKFVIGIATMIAGVVLLIVGGQSSLPMLLLVGVMMLFFAAGVGIIVHGGIMNSMCDLDQYNLDAASLLSDTETDQLLDSLDDERRERYLRTRRINDLAGVICSVIMLIATMTALLLPFFTKSGGIFWIAWPIGGTCCGVVGIISNFLTQQR